MLWVDSSLVLPEFPVVQDFDIGFETLFGLVP